MKNSASAPRICGNAVSGVLGLLLLILLVAGARAQSTYTWDSDATAANGVTDGAGTWDTTTANWFSGGTDVVWSNASPYNNAVFGGGGTGGSIVIGSALYANSLTFNASGYVLSGSSLYLQSTASSGTPAITVAANVNAEVDNYLTETGASNTYLSVASGGTLTLAGGSSVGTLNLGVTAGGTINLNGGTFGTSMINVNTAVVQGASTVKMGTLQIGYNGSASYTMNDAGAVLQDTGVLNIGRGPTGTFDLKQGSATIGSYIAVGFNRTSTLDVEGGTLTMTGTGTNGLLYINYGAVTANYGGTVNLSGGVMTVGGIQFGNGSTAYGAGTTGALNVTGGTLYVGSGGIAVNGVAPASNTVSLSGGTVGATANWSSSMAMALGSGGATFQAANASGTASNIALGGILSGTGSLTKTGGGMLTLSGANTYTGATAVNAGTLSVTGSLANTATTVANGGTLMGTGTIGGATTLQNGSVLIAGDGASTGTSLAFTGGLAMDAGSSLEFVLGSGGAHSVLTLSSSATNSFASGLSITFLDIQAGTYDNLITGFASDPGTESTWTVTNAGYTTVFSYDGSGGIDATVSAVPEPGTAALLAAGAVALLLFGLHRRPAAAA